MQGITVSGYYGHMTESRNGTDIDIAALDADRTFLVTFKHDDKLDDKSEAIFQCALLLIIDKMKVLTYQGTLLLTVREESVCTQFLYQLLQSTHKYLKQQISTLLSTHMHINVRNLRFTTLI